MQVGTYNLPIQNYTPIFIYNFFYQEEMKNDPKELQKQRDQTILASLPNDEFFWFSLL